MKKILLLFLCSLVSLTSVSQEKNDETTIYYFIRHAEKQRTNPTDKNPSLTFQGLKRADAWAEVLSEANINLVYTTDYNRTKETAQPTAEKNGLSMYVYNPKNMYNDGFKYNTKGKNVLIVGHSNTTPAFVNKILGYKKYAQIADDVNGNLYIVTVTKSGATSVVLQINSY